jgi:hypothetical protein
MPAPKIGGGRVDRLIERLENQAGAAPPPVAAR